MIDVEGALPAIESAIRRAVGNRFALQRQEQISGGGTHLTLVVSDSRSSYFVKLDPTEGQERFEAEADGLLALRANGAFRVPELVAVASSDTCAMLILEHLTLRPLRSSDDGRHFAEALATLHRDEGEQFGWHRDNFIGLTPQANTPSGNWSRFFAEQRLRPQLILACANGFADELRKPGERLIDRVPALFLDYRPQPSLLHGDLWHGNAGVGPSGEPVIFDPAAHFGDRESDIAMSELFGGFPASFYATYRELWPLNPDYEARKPLYILYHLLNHLNLFGRPYLGETVRQLTRLNSALSLRSG